MKRYIFKSLLMAALLLGLSTQAYALDVAKYETIVKGVVQGALSGSPDVDDLIAKNKELITMGKQACRAQAKKKPADAKLMNLVADNAEKMQAMSLDEIEEAWHDGDFITANGIDLDSYDHYGDAISLMDTIIHPATSIIALNEYKKSKDKALLKQVKEELSEVLEHIKHVND
jgi:hypothetical protein